MAVLQVSYGFAGVVGVVPRQVSIQTSDTYDDITTSGYLNNLAQFGYKFNPTDILYVTYIVLDTRDSKTGVFKLAIDAGIYTLITGEAYTVIGAVVDGDFAEFSGPLSISDSGMKLSNPANTSVVMYDPAYPIYLNPSPVSITTFADDSGTINAAHRLSANIYTRYCMVNSAPVTAGNFPKYFNSTGCLQNSTYTPSNPALTNVAMATLPTVPGQYAIFSDSSGTLSSTATSPTTSILWAGLNNSISCPGDGTFTNIPFNTTYISNPTYTITGGNIVINTPGVYYFSMSVSVSLNTGYDALYARFYLYRVPFSGEPTVDICQSNFNYSTQPTGLTARVMLIGVAQFEAGDYIFCDTNSAPTGSYPYIVNPSLNSSFTATNIMIKQLTNFGE